MGVDYDGVVALPEAILIDLRSGRGGLWGRHEMFDPIRGNACAWPPGAVRTSRSVAKYWCRLVTITLASPSAASRRVLKWSTTR
ncbi:MAG: hypothetical protein ACRDSR_03505 [Pseudonocardiaceae bacterium]